MSKRKRKPQMGKTQITAGEVILVCRCGTQKTIERQEREDVGLLLDREAKGWYTNISGICLCPNCTYAQGTIPPHFSGKVH